jgi:hypothetical protein
MKKWDRFTIQPKLCMAAMAGALLMSALVSPAAADTVRWRTIIGIEDAGNTVGNIGGGGQPWSTLGGRAKVDLASGRVDFEVEGLVLAGGNTIGTPGAIDQVKGTIVCIVGPANSPTTLAFDTPLVPLSAQGNAEFSGSVGPIPSTCNSSNTAFLVRIAAGRWIANGAVRSSSD